MDHPLHLNRFLAIYFLRLNRLFFWALGILIGDRTVDEIMLFVESIGHGLSLGGCGKLLRNSEVHILIIVLYILSSCKWLVDANIQPLLGTLHLHVLAKYGRK
jgi:hypothetical protein